MQNNTGLVFLPGFCVQGNFFWAGTTISSRILCPGLLFLGWDSYFFQDSVSRATISGLLFLPGFCVQGYYFWAGTRISSRILCPGLLFLGWYSYFFQDSVSRSTVSGLELLFLPGFCVQGYYFWAGTRIPSRILCPGLLFLGWYSYFFQDSVSRATVSGLELLFLPGFCVQGYYFWAGTPISSRILCPGLLFLGWDSYFFQDPVSRDTISGLGLVFLPGFCVQGYYFSAGTHISFRILCPGLLFLGWDTYFVQTFYEATPDSCGSEAVHTLSTLSTYCIQNFFIHNLPGYGSMFILVKLGPTPVYGRYVMVTFLPCWVSSFLYKVFELKYISVYNVFNNCW